jgi:hypothetical protein
MMTTPTEAAIQISAFLLTSSLGFCFIVAGFLLAALIMHTTFLIRISKSFYNYLL